MPTFEVIPVVTCWHRTAGTEDRNLRTWNGNFRQKNPCPGSAFLSLSEAHLPIVFTNGYNVYCGHIGALKTLQGCGPQKFLRHQILWQASRQTDRPEKGSPWLAKYGLWNTITPDMNVTALRIQAFLWSFLPFFVDLHDCLYRSPLKHKTAYSRRNPCCRNLQMMQCSLKHSSTT